MPTAKASPDHDDDVDDIEEWTFVGDDTEITNISQRMRERAVSDADKMTSSMFLQ